jgi:hypothetical protein
MQSLHKTAYHYVEPNHKAPPPKQNQPPSTQLVCHPEPSEGSAFAVAFAFAFAVALAFAFALAFAVAVAFLSVIPLQGNLLV